MPDRSSKWAVLIGIDQYHESLGSLKYAGADCRALRDVLVSGPLGFPEDQVLLLDDTGDPDLRPTFANIHSYLGSWLAAPKEDDLVFVYFAGHGRLLDGKNYLVPGDATLSSLHTLGIPLRHVQDVIENCKAKRKLLVLDACHSGAGRDVAVMADEMQEALAQGTGFYTISSCGADELSHEWDEKGHGVFSHFLAQALTGGCAPAADGRLTVDRVYEWIHNSVTKWAAQHRCKQSPQRYSAGTGSMVLTESPPDHAALSDQYQRELSLTKARLAELELREAQEKLKEGQRDLRRRRLRSVRARVRALQHVCAHLGWPFWLFVALVLPMSWGIAAWARFVGSAANAAVVSDAEAFYWGTNVFLIIGFGILIGNGGKAFAGWSDERAWLVGCMGTVLYAMVAIGGVFVWQVVLLLPIATAFFVLRSGVALLLVVLLPTAWTLGVWGRASNAAPAQADVALWYLTVNLIMTVGFALIVGYGGRDLNQWHDERAGLVGFMGAVFYGMVVLGGFFFWPINLCVPLVACLMLIPSEDAEKATERRKNMRTKEKAS